MNEKITLSINKLLRFCLPPLIKYTSSEFSARKTIEKHEHGGSSTYSGGSANSSGCLQNSHVECRVRQGKETSIQRALRQEG